MTLTIGSLCSGVDGLALGLGGHVAWQCDNDPSARAVLAARYPGVPCHDDVRALPADLAPVDLVCAGYPCQPFSHAGLRKGTDDPRHLWPAVRDAIRHLGPRWVVLENVRGHVNLGLGAVLGDLAELGFDAEWGLFRSSDVGAPHQRARVFVVARHPHPHAAGERRPGRATRQGAGGDQAVGRETGDHPGDVDAPRAPAHAAGPRRQGRDHHPAPTPPGGTTPDTGRPGTPGRAGGGAPPHAGHDRRDRGPQRDGAPPPGLDGARGHDAHRRAVADVRRPHLGRYEPAVARWEQHHGPAPAPLDDRGRLAPAFAEWMLGLPAGWVTGLDLPRRHAFRLIGNAVQPQVAALAWATLAPAFDDDEPRTSGAAWAERWGPTIRRAAADPRGGELQRR